MADRNPKRAAKADSGKTAKTNSAKSTAKAPAAKRAGAGTAKGKRAKKPLTAKRVIGRIFLGLLVGVLVLMIGAAVGAIWFYQRTELPDPNKDFQTNTTFIYYNDGKTKIGNFAIQNRTSISYEAMGDPIKDAVIAAENRTFWTDRGISPTGIARSAFNIIRGGEIQGGGSTITQQYIKIYYLTSDQTMSRKFRELALVVKMGKEKSKQEILTDYLNTIYFGRGAYGVQAASRAYFNIDAGKLSISQAAVLASVLNNPSLYDPSGGEKNQARLLDRYRYVLDGMLEMGKITQAQHDEAYTKLPTFPEIPENNRYGGTKGYLMAMVRDELLNQGFSDAQISGGGLQVTTTFDAKLQAQAVKTAQSYTASIAKDAAKKQDPSKLHIAIASVQVGTGEVLAMYGGADYVKNTRNWATTPRPAASTFKAYAAAAGLRNGFSLRSTFNGNTFTPTGDSVPVRNEFSMQYGPTGLTKATAESVNTAFVDMTQQMKDTTGKPNGPAAVIKAANDAGVPTGPGWDPNNRISLGTAEVSPLANASGFATFANEGKQVTQHVVKKVTDQGGKVLYQAKTQGKQAIDAGVAADVTYALKSVVDQGTGGRVGELGYDIAGKTGTSGVGDAITSAWFVAYTKQISTAVMFVEGDAGNGDLDPYKRPGDGTFFGGTYPAMVWADYMKVAMDGLPNQSFPEPAWVNTEGKGATPTGETTPTGANTPSTTPSITQTPSAPTTTSAPPTSSPPSTEPTEPSVEPTEPTTAPTEPTQEPTEPTQAPTTAPTATAPASNRPSQKPTNNAPSAPST